jgi:RimJ/RimL family protein N-acetyltransferase
VPPGAGSVRRRIARLRLPLRGPRVDLISVSSERIPELTQLLNDRSVAHGTLHIAHPYKVENARWWVRRATRDRRRGDALPLSIVRRSDRALVGGVGLHQLREEAACAEVGYWVGRPFRGQGYATEAVDLLLRAGFDRLGLHRIEALVFPRNAASRRVLARLGFRYEGRIRDEARKDGRWYSTLLFSRLATDPPRRGRSRVLGRAGSQPRRRR